MDPPLRAFARFDGSNDSMISNSAAHSKIHRVLDVLEDRIDEKLCVAAIGLRHIAQLIPLKAALMRRSLSISNCD